MATDTREKPGIDEQYQTAGNTSDLTVEADRRGAADIIIAAGWSDSRVGMALMRLMSEWDSAAKPRRPTEATVRAIALRMTGHRPIEAARIEAAKWYATELRMFAQSLNSRAAVLEQMHHRAALRGIPAEVVGHALMHWLDGTCRTCDGHGFRRVPDAPVISSRQCRACNATGKAPQPEGAASLQGWMDDCVSIARRSIVQRLHDTRK